MKKIYTSHFLLRVALFAVLIGTYHRDIYANSSPKKQYYYFATLTVQTSGEGKVYASATASSSDNATAKTSTAGPIQDPQNYGTNVPANGSATFYAYAKGNDGYKFDGWSESSTRPTTFLSEEASYTYTISIPTATSTTNSEPSTAVNAYVAANNSDAVEYYSRTTSKTLYAYF